MGEKAKYYKCALQVNSFSYTKYRGNIPQNEQEYNQRILERCWANDISVVGLADHGSVDSSSSLRTCLQNAVNILRWRSHPISWNRAMESVIESHSSDGGSHDPCRGSQ